MSTVFASAGALRDRRPLMCASGRFVRRFAWLLIVLSGCAGRHALVVPAAAPPGAEASLHQLEDQWADAYVHHDAATMERLLGDDYIMTMNLGGIRSKAQYVGMVGGDTASHQSIVREEERIKVYGTTAVVTYKPTRTTAGVARTFRTTDVWVYRDGHWQLVARQITEVPADVPRE